MVVSKKVILLGHFGVGKTSLIKRFIHEIFEERYLTTIGVKVDKKVINIHGVDLTMLIWDIAGETRNDRVANSYKAGSHGIFYVFDVSRPSTYEKLDNEIAHLTESLPNVPIQVLGNKIDLLNEKSLKKLESDLSSKHVIFTSAKDDLNVEVAFRKLGEAMLS